MFHMPHPIRVFNCRMDEITELIEESVDKISTSIKEQNNDNNTRQMDKGGQPGGIEKTDRMDEFECVKTEYLKDLEALFTKLNVCEKRHQEILEILTHFPHVINNILDIGIGDGSFSKYFSCERGWKVIGTCTDDFVDNQEELEKYGIKIEKAWLEHLPFDNETFDAVFCSHVFEHVYDWEKSLAEIWRVLKPHGYLLLFLPRFSETVCCGHINTGWNLGQLLYVLMINKFWVRDGAFIEYGRCGNNLCAFVRKEEFTLPQTPDPFARGELHVWSDYDIYPVKLYMPPEVHPLYNNGFLGDFMSLNWPNPEILKYYEKDKADAYNPRYIRTIGNSYR